MGGREPSPVDKSRVNNWKNALATHKRVRLLALLALCVVTLVWMGGYPSSSNTGFFQSNEELSSVALSGDEPFEVVPPVQPTQADDPIVPSNESITTSDEPMMPIEEATPSEIPNPEPLDETTTLPTASPAPEMSSAPELPLATVFDELDPKLPEHNYTCANFPGAKIGKLTMMYGAHDDIYERSLYSQLAHSDLHGYPVIVLREKIMRNRLWTKPAFILSALLNEMSKPEGERLEWFWWFDADTYLTNPNIPLEVFLPPEPHSRHISFMCGRDHNGLNDGAFFIRVNDYAVHLFAASLSVESFHREVFLKYSCQSGLEYLLHGGEDYRPLGNLSESYFNGWAEIPRRWINAYMGERNGDGSLKTGAKAGGNNIREGDLMVHFVGTGATKARRMAEFINAREEDQTDTWQKPLDNTGLVKEIARYWAKYPEKQKNLWDNVISKAPTGKSATNPLAEKPDEE